MGLPEKIPIKKINNLSYTEFFQEYEMDPCQAVSLEEKIMTQNVKEYFARNVAYLSSTAEHGTVCGACFMMSACTSWDY